MIVQAVRLIAIRDGAALEVLPSGYRLQMRSPDTVTHAAKVVQFQPLRDGADLEFVADAVRESRSANLATSELSVPTTPKAASPQPACLRLIHMAPEARLNGAIGNGASGEAERHAVEHSLIVHGTQAPRTRERRATIHRTRRASGTGAYSFGH